MGAVFPSELGDCVGAELDGQLLFVDVDVVSAAQEEEVAVVRRAAVFPVVDVVGVGPADRAVATGEPAAVVAGCDLAEQLSGDGVPGAAEGFGCSVGVAQDDVDRAVAQVGGGARG